MSKRFKVGLDFGHGGKDPGAIGPTGLREKMVNLSLGLMVAKYLETTVDVVTTRKGDYSLGNNQAEDLNKRVGLMNYEKCDIAVSLHCNASTNRNANYFAVYVYKLGGYADKLAHKVIDRVLPATGWHWGADDDGVREGNLAFVRQTYMPAILIENNFISNPAIEAKLQDVDFQKLLAKAIADGILDYLGVELPQNPSLQFKDGTTIIGMMKGSHMWVPARPLLDKLGVEVEKWDNHTKTGFLSV